MKIIHLYLIIIFNYFLIKYIQKNMKYLNKTSVDNYYNILFSPDKMM